ncbi:MAG: hypothetical protein JJT94_15335 [Bernardetiaceae bacterium]|nr:hypothetical protein [Bernardetiaceae bacterium]
MQYLNFIILFYCLFFAVLPATAQQDFEGIIDYTSNARLRAKFQVKDEKKDYPRQGGEGPSFACTHRLYFKGNKIRVEKAGHSGNERAFNSEKFDYWLHEFIDLDSNMYYRFKYDKVPADYRGEINPEHIELQVPFSDYRNDIKEVTLLEDSSKIHGKTARLYRIRYHYPEYFQFVWIDKEATVFPSHYPPLFYAVAGVSLDVAGKDKTENAEIDKTKPKSIDDESRIFNDFSDYFQGLILHTEVSETHLLSKSKNSLMSSVEMYSIETLRNIEEKELPDELFEIKIAN